MPGGAASTGSRRTVSRDGSGVTDRPRRALHGIAAAAMTAGCIVIATPAGGVSSVLVAARLAAAVPGRIARHLVSLSTGVLLAVAPLDALPGAFESRTAPPALFATLPGGPPFFIMPETAELYRRGITTRATAATTPTSWTRVRPAAATGPCCSATASANSATA
jgi:hypothetical protein